jgi:hypothetical protein
MVDKPNQNMLRVLYHNVQSLHNKLGELSLISSLNHMNMDVLCFTEHWLSSDHINIVNIDQFKLVSSFNRNNWGGGSCIFVRKFLQTKQINYLYGIGLEKSFELSAFELLDLKIVIVHICRSADGNFNEFLHKLELVINRIQGSWKRLILCGDWNINFLQQSTKLQGLQNLLMFNLVNMVQTPTRLSREANCLIDVMIIDNLENDKYLMNIDLGYSDHLAQVLYLRVYTSLIGSIHKKKKIFL